MAAETPSSPPSSPPPPPPSTAASQYWCYHCDKRVSVETQPGQPDDAIICIECKFGFVESIQLTTSPSILSPPSDHHSHHHHIFGGGVGGGGGGGFPDEPTLGNQFLQVLRLLAQVAREDDAPPPPPPPPQPRPLNPEDPSPSDESDFLRIEIDGWDEDEENENENENESENHNNNSRNNNISNDIFINNNGDGDVEVEHEEEDDDDEEDDEDEDDDDDDDVRSVEIVEQSDEDEDEREEDIRRRRRDVLRLRLRDFANRARSEGRNRILDWAEILMGLEDNSIEFRFELPEATDRYIGNPGDYVDAAEYEALLQNLADAEGRRGAPPASKAAVEGLKAVEIKTVEESYVCAICKDGVNVGDIVKEMPCGHGYHGDCIVPWLASRNSCPVCRFELPTEDADYEEERKKKFPGGSSSGSSAGNSV